MHVQIPSVCCVCSVLACHSSEAASSFIVSEAAALHCSQSTDVQIAATSCKPSWRSSLSLSALYYMSLDHNSYILLVPYTTLGPREQVKVVRDHDTLCSTFVAKQALCVNLPAFGCSVSNLHLLCLSQMVDRGLVQPSSTS